MQFTTLLALVCVQWHWTDSFPFGASFCNCYRVHSCFKFKSSKLCQLRASTTPCVIMDTGATNMDIERASSAGDPLQDLLDREKDIDKDNKTLVMRDLTQDQMEYAMQAVTKYPFKITVRAKPSRKLTCKGCGCHTFMWDC